MSTILYTDSPKEEIEEFFQGINSGTSLFGEFPSIEDDINELLEDKDDESYDNSDVDEVLTDVNEV